MFVEQREEMTLRLEQCVDAIYQLRPKSVDNHIDKIMGQLLRHEGEFKLYYLNATLKIEGDDQATRLMSSVFGVEREQMIAYHIEVAMALSIVCENCHETHYHSVIPLRASFSDQVKAYNLVGAIQQILNG